MKNFSKEIKAYALKNAVEFGKADASKILPKLFQHGLKKTEIKKIMPEIQASVKEINSLNEEQKQKMFSEYEKYIKVREEREGLPELPNAKGKLVFRAAPYPSGALHIGNARTFLLNSLYAEKYKGGLIRRNTNNRPSNMGSGTQEIFTGLSRSSKHNSVISW